MAEGLNQKPIFTMVLFYILAIVTCYVNTSYKSDSAFFEFFGAILVSMIVYFAGMKLSTYYYHKVGQKMTKSESTTRITFWILGCVVFAIVAAIGFNFWISSGVIVLAYFATEVIYLKLLQL